MVNKIQKIKRLVGLINKIILVKLTKKRIPVFVQIMLTNRCNLSCVYCIANKKVTEELKTEEILELIPQLYKLGTRFISFAGGEPLLRDDLEQIVDFCKHKNIFTHLSTNALLLKEKLSVISQLDFITVSLDGVGGVHDRYRSQGT